MTVRRVRLLIYEAESEERMEQQRSRDVKMNQWGGDGPNRMRIDSIELDPCRITLLELLRLWHRETKKEHGL